MRKLLIKEVNGCADCDHCNGALQVLDLNPYCGLSRRRLSNSEARNLYIFPEWCELEDETDTCPTGQKEPDNDLH